MPKMVRVKRNQSTVILQKETILKKDVGEEETTVLQKLASDEANLMEEKKNLMSLREKLYLKLKDEIEIKKKNTQKLRAEIDDLKVSCERLSKSINVKAK